MEPSITNTSPPLVCHSYKGETFDIKHLELSECCCVIGSSYYGTKSHLRPQEEVDNDTYGRETLEL